MLSKSRKPATVEESSMPSLLETGSMCDLIAVWMAGYVTQATGYSVRELHTEQL
jgi:hypothetical protein